MILEQDLGVTAYSGNKTRWKRGCSYDPDISCVFKSSLSMW